jgi:methylated-DNA-[protein]-cysteine S-methyltransferase
MSMRAATAVVHSDVSAAVILERFELTTPIGAITCAVRNDRICALGFSDRWPGLEQRVLRRFGAVSWREARGPIASALDAYLRGRLDALDDVRTDTAGTPFQESVWAALRTIPVGRTWSYRDLARVVGRPAAVRAVGLANGSNPVSIVVPCHRVIGADGTLTGYGGGLDRKAWLLSHEGAQLPLAVAAAGHAPPAISAPAAARSSRSNER